MKIGTLETKKQEVQSKCEGFEKLVLKFSKGHEDLDKLLAFTGCHSIKKDLGVMSLTKKRVYKNIFIQLTSKNKSDIKCNYCLNNGHMSYSCLLENLTLG